MPQALPSSPLPQPASCPSLNSIAVQAIKYAIDSNPDNAGLQEKACAALRCLADGSAANAAILIEEGCGTSLIEVHPTPPPSPPFTLLRALGR